ncbi:hypothetical protein J6590_030666 [Homalodisca vitripennis]|nr:hypothetical protein J6590_030666 [Homalodisca vitripennis]
MCGSYRRNNSRNVPAPKCGTATGKKQKPQGSIQGDSLKLLCTVLTVGVQLLC